MANNVCKRCGHVEMEHEQCEGQCAAVLDNGISLCDCPGYVTDAEPPTPVSEAGTTIKVRLGKNGEIIVLAVREEGDAMVTDSISLEGLIAGAVMGNPADLERYRRSLKGLSLELMAKE